ncbi:MAG: hypothetical protein GWO08_19255, partial [Gammaproteobacteria bacterium]|nr:hypothetical protein [Gammaproteobacteria bacterium]NIR95695.1 hypothetical protein [Gammaproteobacteria bacterium]
EKVGGEAVEVTRKRNKLKNEKAAREKTLSSCRLVSLRSDELIKRIGEVQKQTLAQQL